MTARFVCDWQLSRLDWSASARRVCLNAAMILVAVLSLRILA